MLPRTKGHACASTSTCRQRPVGTLAHRRTFLTEYAVYRAVSEPGWVGLAHGRVEREILHSLTHSFFQPCLSSANVRPVLTLWQYFGYQGYSMSDNQCFLSFSGKKQTVNTDTETSPAGKCHSRLEMAARPDTVRPRRG